MCFNFLSLRQNTWESYSKGRQVFYLAHGFQVLGTWSPDSAASEAHGWWGSSTGEYVAGKQGLPGEYEDERDREKQVET